MCLHPAHSQYHINPLTLQNDQTDIQSVAVVEFLVVHADAGVDEEPSADADEVDECDVEYTPSGISGEHYWMVPL
jgi:hypothetical protein